MNTRILVVDDEPAIRSALRRALQGYEVVAAANAEDALQLLRAGEFAAVLSDMNLGTGMRGAAFLAIVAERWRGTGRVAMNGADQGEARTAVDSGVAHEFLLKPWDPDGLLATIRRAMGKAAKERRT